MSGEDFEHRYFEHLTEYQVAVCRECRYAVWPDQIEGHLQKLHKQPRNRARATITKNSTTTPTLNVVFMIQLSYHT
ncbi:hypothetical protein PSPO01_16574 [Paraphaeosphaeria sporulosa]